MKSIFCLLLCSLCLSFIHAQGWERLYPHEFSSSSDRLFLTPMADGGFLMTEDIGFGANEENILIRLSPEGLVEWTQEQQATLGITRPVALPLGNGELLFIGKSGTTKLVKTNSNLDIQWSKTIPGASNYSFLWLKQTPGGYLIAGSTGNDFGATKIIKTDLDGNVIWDKTFQFGNYQAFTGMRYFHDLVSDSQGNVYVTGVEDFPYVPRLVKISSDGDSIFMRRYTQPALIYGMSSLTVVNDNRIVGSCNANVAVVDSNGALVGTIPQPACQIANTGDGNLFFAYGENSNLYIRKVTLGGTELWKSSSDLVWNMEWIRSLWPMPDGGAASIGWAFTGTHYNPYVIRTDADGITFHNLLQGEVFADLDENCTHNPGIDLPAKNLIVKVIKHQDTWYTMTDTAGHYELRLDTGAYLLRLQVPNALWKLCADSIPVTISAPNDTVQQDAAITSNTDCPWPEVTIGAPFLRRCFPSTYTINYANTGAETADSAAVRLTLDPFLELQTASIPYQQTGQQVYEFYIGSLPPLSQGSFTVTVLVDCDSTVLGQTHCTTAEMLISNPCLSNQLDTPVISVEAACEGDSVAFTLRNIGGASMPATAEFIVIEDLIVMREGLFQLDIQVDTVVKCPSDGSTFRMYAGQTPGDSPFFSTTAAIEGCNGPIQPGFWNMYPELYSVSAARDCQPNIGAYDPNDKQAVPVGYDEEHYIERGIPLEYTIRFQNTGTDTAFNIAIRDTLSPWLNPGSVRPGVSSHPYHWALLGQNVLEFKFDNILLPDSNVNLSGSNGYVRFLVEQHPGLPLETDVFNRAAIYFDYNPPVITNTTHHRVGKNFIKVSSWSPENPVMRLKAFPNPVLESATVELSNIPANSSLEWILSDVSGREVLNRTTTGGRLDIQRSGMPAGIYWLQVREKGRLLGNGKLVFY